MGLSSFYWLSCCRQPSPPQQPPRKQKPKLIHLLWPLRCCLGSSACQLIGEHFIPPACSLPLPVKRLGLLLLALRDEDGSAFTDAEVRDEALTLILSGHETTANALTWAFSWLGTRPDVHAALRREALQQDWVTGSAPATVADVMSCEVAGQVISETLRMAPPVWVAPRRALADVDIEGVKVPQGAHVLISQYVTQRDPHFFPKPHTWQPSRWTEQLHASLPRGAYFPFGAGTRKCLGDQFALLESRIILLHAAARTQLVAADPNRPIPKAEPRATYRARGPVPMVVT